MRRLTVVWKVSSLASRVASVRYRALLPGLALEDIGFECRFFSDPHAIILDGIDALIIVKGLGLGDYALARRAYAKNIPIILDLCDNIFIDNYGQTESRQPPSPHDVFVSISRYACAIVVPTDTLAERVRQCLDDVPKIIVIPDGVQSSALFKAINKRLQVAQRLQYQHLFLALRQRARQGLQRFHDFGWIIFDPLINRMSSAFQKNSRMRVKLAQFNLSHLVKLFHTFTDQLVITTPGCSVTTDTSTRLKLVWFGFHGAEHAAFGMLDLLLIKSDLEQIADEFDVELVVISNHQEKFNRHIKPLKIRSRYREWSAVAVEEELDRAALALIPNSKDAFSICKSANRTVLALNAGVPVVATMTSGLLPLSGVIQCDDFLNGMRLYLSDPLRASHDVHRAQKQIQQAYCSTRIASLWCQVLEPILPAIRAESAPNAELIISIHLIMDIPFALPVMRRAHSIGIPILVLCNAEIRLSKPDIEVFLKQNCPRYALVHWKMLDRNFIFPKKVTALLTFSESNLRPHSFNYQLTMIANQAGISTYTMQHGFENVGLTYDDAVQPIKSISFASKHIFIWGEMGTLHPTITGTNRGKCLPVGCPKPLQDNPFTLPIEILVNTVIIGVFENLHWSRYPEEYREAFIENVVKLAQKFPSVTLLVKPHNAGLWLTQRFRGRLPMQPNLIVADPKSSRWGSAVATSLFWRCTAVITTPSTVALDAARYGLPVAVVADGFHLDNYSPLPLLRTELDWQNFASDAMMQPTRQQLLTRAQEFCQRVVLPGDAALRILQTLFPGRTSEAP